MDRTTTWCLVCDASRATLFRETTPRRTFEPIESFAHPESRLRVRDLMADAQGRKPVGGSRGDGQGSRPGGFHGRPGAEPDTDPKEVEAQKFARDLVATLEKGFDDHAYDALILVAPPHFLGMLRAMLSDRVTRKLVTTIDKDLAALDAREIERRVKAERAA
jgi:protein required for attachment to host cells